MSETSQHLRMLEALLFAAEEPLDEASLAARMPDGADVTGLLGKLSATFENRGVNLAQIGGKWQFRTAPDLRYLLELHRQEPRRLSRAALETLAIIAYHQPITRAEIEEVRGVGLSKGTLDILMEIGWVRPKGRKRAPRRRHPAVPASAPAPPRLRRPVVSAPVRVPHALAAHTSNAETNSKSSGTHDMSPPDRPLLLCRSRFDTSTPMSQKSETASKGSISRICRRRQERLRRRLTNSVQNVPVRR